MQDHINEIHGKWEAIEDDIWAKIIVMERNRRVAKAYIRSPTITIGGGKEGFDGQRIGLEGFENPLRDEETTKIKKRIGNQVLAIRVFNQIRGRICFKACKIRMDDDGNVQIKRTGKTEVSVLGALETGDRRQADMISRSQGLGLETDRTVSLFDMEMFQRSLADCLRQGQGQSSRDMREIELQVSKSLETVNS